jgi:hypothetical protein
MKKENIKKLANEIARLEKECQSGNNISDAMRKIEQITYGLSIEEMLTIDEYILEEKLLTK